MKVFRYFWHNFYYLKNLFSTSNIIENRVYTYEVNMRDTCETWFALFTNDDIPKIFTEFFDDNAFQQTSFDSDVLIEQFRRINAICQFQ